MKKIILLLMISNLVFSQIDTTDWFPLEVGNKWQYSYGLVDVERYTREVTADTTMPNGKTYAVFDGLFLRNHQNKFVYKYNPLLKNEEVYFDFYSQDGTVFNNSCGIKQTLPPSSLYYQDNLTNLVHEYYLPSKVFETIVIDSSISPPDTNWGIVDIPTIIVTKGIGITPSTANESLDGFIINGVQYGVITDIADRNSNIDSYELCQNYPNPFNPTTTISFVIPKSGFVTLVVYNSIGQKIKTLVSNEKFGGIYHINFDTNDLSSGIYFYKINVNNFTQTRKMLLLK